MREKYFVSLTIKNITALRIPNHLKLNIWSSSGIAVMEEMLEQVWKKLKVD